MESEEVEECFEVGRGDVASRCRCGCAGVLILVVIELLHTLSSCSESWTGRFFPKRHSNRRFPGPIPPCKVYDPMQDIAHMGIHPDGHKFAYIVCCCCGGRGGGDGEVV